VHSATPNQLFLLLLFAAGTASVIPTSFAQEGGPATSSPGPSKGGKGSKGDKGEKIGKEHRPRGGGPGSGKKMEFADLSEEERNQVKEALRVVWADPEVRSARKELSEASKRYRETLHAAMENAAPEVRPILVRMFERMAEGGPGGPGGHGGRRIPPAIAEMDKRFEAQSKEANFIGAVAFLQKEVDGVAPAEMKTRYLELHAEITSDGSLDQELAAVRNATEPEVRREAFRAYRQVYFRKIFEQEPGILKDVFGDRAPGGPDGSRMRHEARPEE